MIDQFALVCPPPMTVGSKAASEMSVAQSLQTLYDQVAAFARNKRLGVLGRARLAKALQSELQQREYPDAMVSQLVNAVTVMALVKPDLH